MMARSSLIFFSRIFCVFKVNNARLTLLWMAEMSVVYHRLGWAALSAEIFARCSKTWLFSPSSPWISMEMAYLIPSVTSRRVYRKRKSKSGMWPRPVFDGVF